MLRRLRKALPTLVFTWELNGGLYQMMHLFRCRSFGALLVYCKLWVNPLFPRALSYVPLAFSNSSLSYERAEIRSSIIDGSCLMMQGGWLESLWMYRGELSGLE